MTPLYREMRLGEESKICAFIAKIFNEFVAPEFSDQGIKTFLVTNTEADLRDRLRKGATLILAEENGILVGVIEVVDQTHISRFFVEGSYQKRGVGRGLLERAIRLCLHENPNPLTLTVNSSPNSVAAYESLGFKRTADEQVSDGIRYVPMVLEVPGSA